jgi:mRNA-degrading endonuclease toxin of MazEF toxin-antitoxin module
MEITKEIVSDFDVWNVKKKQIDKYGNDNQYFNVREVWWCSIGLNIGSEQNGKNDYFERPVLIFKKFNNKMAWIIPITSKNKISQYYFPTNYRDKTDSLILSQLRLISTKRLRRFVRRVSTYEFAMITGQLSEIIKY